MTLVCSETRQFPGQSKKKRSNIKGKKMEMIMRRNSLNKFYEERKKINTVEEKEKKEWKGTIKVLSSLETVLLCEKWANELEINKIPVKMLSKYSLSLDVEKNIVFFSSLGLSLYFKGDGAIRGQIKSTRENETIGRNKLSKSR